MIKLKFSLFNWLFNRSPHNAANPKVPQTPLDQTSYGNAQDTIPIDSYSEAESIFGTSFKVGLIKKVIKHNGQLIRVNDNLNVITGCGHLVRTLKVNEQGDKPAVGVAGQCVDCVKELKQRFEKGEISEFDFTRLSLVCTDCAKITESGDLCCPKHYRATVNPEGKQVYLSAESVKEQKRNDTVRLAGNIFTSFFGLKSQSVKEQDNDQIS